jgi:hypothetical protein
MEATARAYVTTVDGARDAVVASGPCNALGRCSVHGRVESSFMKDGDIVDEESGARAAGREGHACQESTGVHGFVYPSKHLSGRVTVTGSSC